MRKMIYYLILFIVQSASTLANPGDSIKKPFNLGGKVQYGTILPHSELIRPLAFNNPYGIEINFNWLNLSEKAIKQFNCYSYTGLAINYIYFGHPKIGSSINTFFYFEPLLNYQKKLGYGIRAGFGLSYLSDVYNEITNPENKFFASHFAFLLLVEFRVKYRLTKQLEISSSACYNHISNGGFKQPNYGMNFPTLALGINYHFNPGNLKPIVKEKLNPKDKIWKLKAEALMSIKVQNKTDEFEEKACFAYGFSAHANKRTGKFSALNFGLEYIADGYIKEELYRAGVDLDYKRAAGFIGHDLILGKVNFTINIGVYFYSPYKAKDPFYEKYLLQYKLNNHIYSGGYMLAHGDAAEIMGFNLGIIF